MTLCVWNSPHTKSAILHLLTYPFCFGFCSDTGTLSSLGEPSLMHSLSFQREALSSPSLILKFSSPFLLQDIMILGLMELEEQLHRHNPLDQLPLRIGLQVHQL